jgi:hypothetical protein
MDFARALADPRRYREQLDRLHGRLGGTTRAHELEQSGVPLSELFLDKGAAARRVAGAVRRGSYRLSPATTHLALLDRPREVFAFTALDLLVHAVVGELLGEALEPRLSDSVWSYRSGRSSWQAVAKLAALVRRHRRARPDPRTRGLYVFRGDVVRYVENVPVDGPSALWPQLAQLTGLDPASPAWALLSGVVRPLIADEEGTLSMRRVGLPMGSPPANMVLNLYLAPLDESLGELGGFYARFGDDLLYVDEDPERVQKAAAETARILAALRLFLNAKKARRYFLNAAGRAAPGFEGTARLSWLGASVSAEGTVGLSPEKLRALWLDLRARIRFGRRLLGSLPLEERTRLLCQLMNEALDPRSELAHPHARLLRTVVTDRRQLAEVDHQLCRLVAEGAAGRSGVRALRTLPPRALRDLGLISLVAQRNRRP